MVKRPMAAKDRTEVKDPTEVRDPMAAKDRTEVKDRMEARDRPVGAWADVEASVAVAGVEASAWAVAWAEVVA